ncbi:MAG: hypothetical protein EA387_00025, partial [Nitriliruptor sp.]
MNVFHDPDGARRVGLALAAASSVAVVGGVALFVAAGGDVRNSWMPQNASAGLALAVAFAAMVRHEPHNGAVWTLGWAAVVLAFGQAIVIGVNEWGLSRLIAAGAAESVDVLTFEMLPTWLAWSISFRDTVWVLGWGPLITLALLLFPDGRLPSPRWRVVAGLSVVGLVAQLVVLAIAFRPRARAGMTLDAYPFTVGLQRADAVVSGVLLIAIVACVASLLVRYRRASGDARRQIRWIAVGGGLVALAHALWVVAIVDLELAGQLVWLGVLASVPALVGSFAVAILRYRLYDIDVVISRSLVVATLAGFIASVYVAVVVGIGRLVGVGDEASLTLKVVATAIVAVAFQPLRQRVRRWADRVVYGHRATPYEVLAGFSQAASAGDEDNLQRIAEMLAAGTGAQPATVWLRVGEQVRAVASSGNGTGPDGSASELPMLPLEGGELPALPASLVVDVRHDGELLGAVSLTKPRSEPPTRQDEELAGRLARGLALVLRNARLTAELREHLAVLQASRSRLVRAQDEARRAIESQLRAGAQQQLGELRGRLGGVARAAATAGAVRTAALLEQLEGEADDADDTLRALGQGIYPPLLEAEGLGIAVAAQAARSALPVTVHAAGLPRYPGEVEVAVYFSILEALQNAAKYSRASSVHVRLEPRESGLWFEVADDGIGFDPHHTRHGSGLTGIAARLDTIDATLHIHSRPGTGTRITGHAPTPPM